MKESVKITEHFSNKQIDDLTESYKSLDFSQRSFFVVTKKDDSITVYPLSKVFNPTDSVQNELNIDRDMTYFAFSDPSFGDNPGWPLRLFLAALLEHCPCLTNADIQTLGLRCSKTGTVDSSRVFTLNVPKVFLYFSIYLIYLK